jgi:hypothetical protein
MALNRRPPEKVLRSNIIEDSGSYKAGAGIAFKIAIAKIQGIQNYHVGQIKISIFSPMYIQNLRNLKIPIHANSMNSKTFIGIVNKNS